MQHCCRTPTDFLLEYHTVQVVSEQESESHGHNSQYFPSDIGPQHSPDPRALEGFEYSRWLQQKPAIRVILSLLSKNEKLILTNNGNTCDWPGLPQQLQ